MKKQSKDFLLKPAIIFILIILTLLMTFFMYYPGLSGDFIFDDVSNLRHIAVYDQYNGLDAVVNYVLSNESGVLKRPISTLSFLLNSTSWPASAFYFKLTNIIIHLINGLLLFFVTCKLLIHLNFDKRLIKTIAILNMAIWLLHPYLVSTTLYVVQRMTMLPTLFILLGLFFYFKARESSVKNPKKSIIYLILSVGLCTLLATLSKENGVILPIVLFVLDNVLNKLSSKNKFNKNIKIIFIIIPSLIVVFAYIYKIPDFLDSYNFREFSLYERLLTQPRVIFNYLYHLFVPHYLTESIYTDGFLVSKSIIHPITTLVSIISLIILIIFAIAQRKKSSVFSFSILFFLTSLFIESSFIPLEIYFEHRSYMSSLFIFLPLITFLMYRTSQYKLIPFFVVLLITYLSFCTYLRSELWSNNGKLIAITSSKFPESVRAVNRRASNLHVQGLTNNAINLLENASKTLPKFNIRLNIIQLKCSISEPIEKDLNSILDTLKHQNMTRDDRNPLIAVFNLLSSKQCISNPIATYHKLVMAIKNSNGYKKNPAIKYAITFHEPYSLLKLQKYEESYSLFLDYLNNYSTYEDILFVSEELIDLKQHLMAQNLLQSLLIKLNKDSKQINFSNYKNKIKTLLDSI